MKITVVETAQMAAERGIKGGGAAGRVGVFTNMLAVTR